VTLLIIDANNMAYRAIFTVNLSNDGVDTSVTYGVMNMIQSTLTKYRNITSVIACFDGGSPAYRKILVPTYKDNRKKDEDSDIDWEDKYRQIDELCYVALPMHGIMTVRKRHVEADDLMAAIARASVDDAYILTGDDDLLQCVSDNVSIVNPTKGLISIDNFEDTFGYPVEYHLFRKMLLGDDSDNIPGVPKVGIKTAEKLIAELIELECEDPYEYIISNLRNLSSLQSLTAFQAGLISDMGILGLGDIYETMDLSVDRSNASMAIKDAVWNQFDKSKVIRYLMANGFISMIGPKYYKLFERLQKPELELQRYPRFSIRLPVREV